MKMFAKFLVVCTIHVISCEFTRNNVDITSPSLAGGIIPSNSITLSNSYGNKITPKGENKSQNLTLKTPLLSVSVKNSTTRSATDTGVKITDAAANLQDIANSDLLPRPEHGLNPRDIMLDLNIPVRLTELEDLTKSSNVEQFKRKMLQSSLADQLFSTIEDKSKYYEALENLASSFPSKSRRKRDTSVEQTFTNDDTGLSMQPHLPYITGRRFFYLYPKKANSEIVYKHDSGMLKSKRDATNDLIFSPASVTRNSASDVVGASRHLHRFIARRPNRHHVHHPLPRHHIPRPVLPPPRPIPIMLPHRPRLPHLLPPPHLPIIPPEVLEEIAQSLLLHPLPPLHLPPPAPILQYPAPTPHLFLSRSKPASLHAGMPISQHVTDTKLKDDDIRYLYDQLYNMANNSKQMESNSSSDDFGYHTLDELKSKPQLLATAQLPSDHSVNLPQYSSYETNLPQVSYLPNPTYYSNPSQFLANPQPSSSFYTPSRIYDYPVIPQHQSSNFEYTPNYLGTYASRQRPYSIQSAPLIDSMYSGVSHRTLPFTTGAFDQYPTYPEDIIPAIPPSTYYNGINQAIPQNIYSSSINEEIPQITYSNTINPVIPAGPSQYLPYYPNYLRTASSRQVHPSEQPVSMTHPLHPRPPHRVLTPITGPSTHHPGLPHRTFEVSDSAEVLESLERTGQLLGNTFFSLFGHAPMMT